MPTLGVTCAFTLGFAHYPWRDRNADHRGATLPELDRSLITPGGIATRHHARISRSSTRVRSLPLEGSQLWRTVRALRSVVVRSLPLEGSQQERGGRIRDGEADRSLITPGGIATPSATREPTGRRRVRSLPLEGSQPRLGEADLVMRCSGSLITPGGIATPSLVIGGVS